MIRRIAVEEAFVTEEIAAEWKTVLAGRFVEPGFRALGDSILGDNPGAQAVHEKLTDLGAGRLAHMDATGIAMQVLSITSPGVQVFDAVTASALTIHANDVLADAVRRHPTRLAGLAAVAPQHPESAARELERAMTRLGLCGAIVNSHTGGVYLDDPSCRPLLEAAEALGAPIYLHPREPPPAMVGPYLDYGLFWAGWGFAAETGLHAMRLIMGGVFERFPKLTIVLGHMGEGIPFWLQRIDNRYRLGVEVGANGKLARLPSEYFRDNFVSTTSGVMDDGALQLSLDALGVERIMFAADYPYESVEAGVAFMDAAKITDDERARIYAGNAEALFRLPSA